jgi:hypothetical protein
MNLVWLWFAFVLMSSRLVSVNDWPLSDYPNPQFSKSHVNVARIKEMPDLAIRYVSLA